MNTEDDEFQRIEREATRGVPDAIHHTDTCESLEYITGWNDCRAAMLAEQPAQQEPVAWGIIASNTGRICQVALDAGEVEGHNPKHIAPLCHCSQAQQEPVAWMYDWICEGELIEGWIAHKESEIPRSLASNIRPLYTTPQAQRTWVGLMRGVRVEGDTVVITVKGGNDAARELCGALLEEKNNG